MTKALLDEMLSFSLHEVCSCFKEFLCLYRAFIVVCFSVVMVTPSERAFVQERFGVLVYLLWKKINPILIQNKNTCSSTKHISLNC